MPTATVLDQALSGHFGNVTGKTYRARVAPPWPASSRITKLRIRLQGHADEPLTIDKLQVGRSGAGAATLDSKWLTLSGSQSFVVPAGGAVDLDELTVDWINPSAISISGYGAGGANSDRLATEQIGGGHDTYLKTGDFVMQADGVGFTRYPTAASEPGYLSLVTHIDCDYEEVVAPPLPEPGAVIPLAAFGCLPMMPDGGDHFMIAEGQWADSGMNPDGWMVIPARTRLDINTQGAWGLAEPKSDGWWHGFLIRGAAAGIPAAVILVKQPLFEPHYWTRITTACPWADRVRYLPLAVNIVGGLFEEQAPISWPKPATFWHQSAGARGGSYNATNWTLISLSAWMPRESRVALIETTGSLRVRTPGKGTGTLVSGRQEVLPSSVQGIEVIGNGTLKVWGWTIMDTY